MSNKFLKDNFNLISFISEILICSIIALLLTLFCAGFDINNMNWTVFGVTDIFNFYCRSAATNYAAQKEKAFNTSVALFLATISYRKKAIVKLNYEDKFNEALSYYNQQKSLELYLQVLVKKNDKLDIEKPKNAKKRVKYYVIIKKINALIELLKDKNYKQYNDFLSEYHLTYYATNYKKYIIITANDLFVGKSNVDKNGNQKVKFNLFSSSVARGLPGFIAVTIVSAVWSGLDGGIKNSDDAWFMLGSYAFAIVMGTTWGLNNGKKVIAEDYQAILSTSLEIISTVLTSAEIYDEVKAESDNLYAGNATKIKNDLVNKG